MIMITMEIETDKSFLRVEKFTDRQLLDECIHQVDNLLLKNLPIKVFNKVCYQRRSIGFFSNTSKGYEYSKQLCPSQKLTEGLEKLLETVNNKFHAQFNGILVNKYEGGTDYIGAHSDDERSLDKTTGVIAISVGETRKFRIRNKMDKKIVKDIQMEDGDLIQMGGNFQKEFTHEIPVEKKKKGTRYSFTFRKHTV